MKKKLMVALAMALTVLGAKAVPACPEPGKVTQPDGSTLTLRVVGDEFYNYNITLDGRTVLLNQAGAYVYAVSAADGSLMPGTQIAHDPTQRQPAEQSYLKRNPNVYPVQSQQMANMRRQQTQMSNGSKGLFNYKKFRGLVILVNFTDRKFSYTNAHEIFTDMVAKKNYDGFMNNAQIPTKEVYTGSVRDYFFDQSMGMFDPRFDVVGPVDIDVSQTYPRQTTNMQSIVRKVIAAADSQVNFKDYDTNNDGMVDMFYIIFAGYGSNYSGNNSNYVWPHAWNVDMFGISADGVRLGRYACSTEFYGTSGNHCIDGIGTVCHEFSHVLGLMDEYDTDYAQGGGQSVDPGDWSVMAGGSYNNKGRTPTGYSLFQRYQSGFTVPKVITEPGEYAVYDIDTCNTGYRINIPDEPKEYFLLENRRKTGSKWNCYGPGQGMLVFRVDSTNTAVWSSNDINTNPAHNYYELIRAKYNGNSDGPGDPFPGTGNVKALTSGTTPALKSWAGYSAAFNLDSIWEKSGVVYFRIKPDKTKSKVEDFEEMVTTGSYDDNVKGRFAYWSFSNAKVEKVSDTNHALAMVKGSSMMSSVIPNGVIKNVHFQVTNNSGSTAYFQLQAMVDGVLTVMNSSSGSQRPSVATNTTGQRVSFVLPDLENTQINLIVKTGHSTNPVYIDNLTIVKDYPNAVESIFATGDNVLAAKVTAHGLEVSTVPGAEVSLYDIQGRRVAFTAADASGTALLNIPARGCYIAVANGKSIKILF